MYLKIIKPFLLFLFMPEKKSNKLYSYEIQKKAGEDILLINYLGAPYVPSLSGYPEVMERTIDTLIENPNVSRVVFVQQKNYNYDFNETSYLLELAQLYVYLVKQEKVLSHNKLVTNNENAFSKRYNEIFSVLLFLKRDPLAAYAELKKIIIEAKILLDKLGPEYKTDQMNYISLLEKIHDFFDQLKLIKAAEPYMEDYQKGDREIYHKLFKPDVIPNFTFTRLVASLPEDAEIVHQYEIGESYDKSIVTILKREQDAKYIYIQNHSPTDYAMNAACSAGTGSFLEESAHGDLGVSVLEISEIAMHSPSPVQFKAECAAFINSDIRAALQEGYSKQDIIGGLVSSIVNNYLTKVKGPRKVGKKVFLQGGVAKNNSIAYAFALATGKQIIVPPNPELMGAYGVALMAYEKVELGLLESSTKQIDELLVSELEILGNFTCRSCDN